MSFLILFFIVAVFRSENGLYIAGNNLSSDFKLCLFKLCRVTDEDDLFFEFPGDDYGDWTLNIELAAFIVVIVLFSENMCEPLVSDPELCETVKVQLLLSSIPTVTKRNIKF